jgi:hypothetical protein
VHRRRCRKTSRGAARQAIEAYKAETAPLNTAQAARLAAFDERPAKAAAPVIEDEKVGLKPDFCLNDDPAMRGKDDIYKAQSGAWEDKGSKQATRQAYDAFKRWLDTNDFLDFSVLHNDAYARFKMLVAAAHGAAEKQLNAAPDKTAGCAELRAKIAP